MNLSNSSKANAGHEREIVVFLGALASEEPSGRTAMLMPNRHPGPHLPGMDLSRGWCVLIGKGHRIGCLNSCETWRSAEGIKEV